MRRTTLVSILNQLTKQTTDGILVLDAELAWRLAKKNALFIFDDYNWETEPVESMHHPRRGIDAFLALHAGQYERLSNPSDYQVVLQKTSDMRIGFLNKEGTQHGLRSALGYSINIALTIDAAYAHAAAVAMRSVVEKTPGRITFYILSIGLDATVRDRLKASVPERADVTTNFVNLPSTGFTAQSGVTWGKIEMIEHLPIERVLYLDADILAVSDVTGIWKTDLLGKSIAAAVDVGFPLGHGEHSGTKYFNAGVLLMDLAKIRTQMSGLVGAVDQALSSRFKDQDALNRQFANDWLELSLEWNAQGLGTYADNYSAERISLSLDSMRASPKIVHFTGPVTPTLSSVLNPYVQPVTAKPWGYMGAPGHPFAATWWDTLECTAWKGWRATDEFRDECRRACKTAEAEGVAAFHAAVSASST
jgi:lipopolysaccharide biosynthesis glycosyltransferase